MVRRAWLLRAGWTQHPAGIARRGEGWRPARFPALVAVIDHPNGIVLFDTGYAPRVRAATAHGADRLYGALLPVHTTEQDCAAAQLARLGIEPAAVTHVVLSHLHADHIGGLADFPCARVIVHPHALIQARRARGWGRLRRGLVPALLPADLSRRVLDPHSLPPARSADLAPMRGRQLFADGSLVIVPLPGHSAGQLGLVVKVGAHELFLIADASWSAATVGDLRLPHPVVRLITADWACYRATIADLHALAARRPELIMVPSHDDVAIERARRALNAERDRGA